MNKRRPPILESDSAIQPPSVTVIAASAGAGKTHVLTLRLIQLLLSNRVRRNGLRNILAITFTKNAAGEMKQRVLEYLKRLALGEHDPLAEFAALLSLDETDLQHNASRMLEEIFDRYSDLQIQTIDSFMTAIFKAAAVELGFTPAFDVALESRSMLADAFELYLRSIELSSKQAHALEEIVENIGATRRRDQSFTWNPYGNIVSRLEPLYIVLGVQSKPLHTANFGDDLTRARATVANAVIHLDERAATSGLERKSNFQTYAGLARENNIDALLNRSLANPLKKPSRKSDLAAYDRSLPEMERRCDEIRSHLGEYALAKARTDIIPYIKTLEILHDALRTVGRRSGKIFLGDIHSVLQRQLIIEAVPGVFFTLGDTIFHFLIDEFQDTNPIQWANIRLLVENALASEGTLFAVGDTKQSIYGFRGADWTIMDRLEHEPEFPSARLNVRSLDTNYRSAERIIRFAEEVFHSIVPTTGYRMAGERSGLSSFTQKVLPQNMGRGYVEIALFDKESDVESPERGKIVSLIIDMLARGYHYGDIAILTPANDTVIEISGWLSEAGIPVISHSNLDVRRRKSAGEVLGLLRFLDSPIDDLSFAEWLLGDLFSAALRHDGFSFSRPEFYSVFDDARANAAEPAYIRFRRRHPEFWEIYFEHLYNVVGFLPLYDLMAETAKIFSFFTANPDEEATLIKILEVARQFEGTGQSTLRNFLEAAADDETAEGWEIKVPEDIDAVSVMTIHKAKGLQWPSVIVLLRDKKEKGFDYSIAEDEDNVELLHIRSAYTEFNPRLAEIYEAQREKERVNFLNGLYVAFTRAEEELSVIGLYTGEPKIPTMFLPTKGYEPGKRPSATRKHKTSSMQAEHVHGTVKPAREIAPIQRFSQTERRRGDILHAVLAQIPYLEGALDEQLNAIFERLHVPVDDRSILRDSLRNFIERSGIEQYFHSAEGRTVFNECEIAGSGGMLYRADRIVVDPGTVTIIDYKTGADINAEEHDRQLRTYMDILRQIYEGSSVNGFAAYVDLQKVRHVQ